MQPLRVGFKVVETLSKEIGSNESELEDQPKPQKTFGVIYKTGDDLRQDQVIELFNHFCVT
jgi:gamma-glutamyltranspeptidase